MNAKVIKHLQGIFGTFNIIPSWLSSL